MAKKLKITANNSSTMYDLAKVFGTTIDELKKYNKLDSNIIKSGQEFFWETDDVEGVKQRLSDLQKYRQAKYKKDKAEYDRVQAAKAKSAQSFKDLHANDEDYEGLTSHQIRDYQNFKKLGLGNSVQDFKAYKEKEHKSAKSTRDLALKAGYGIVGMSAALPVLANPAALKPTARLIGQGLKYNIQHPIESFVAPKVVKGATNIGFDAYENITGNQVSDRVRNNTAAVTNMIVTPSAFNIARGGLTKFGPQVVDESTGAIKKYLFNALSNGQAGATYVGSNGANIIRQAVPSTLGSAAYLGQDALLDGKTIGQTLEEKGVNKTLASGIDYVSNAAIYGMAMQGGNRMMSKPINNANQLSGGAHTAENAMQNFSKAPLKEFFVTGRPAMTPMKNGKFSSYQQIYNASTKQTANNQHQKVMPSYAMQGTPKQIKENAIYYNTYAGNDINVGQNVGAGHTVKAKVRRGSNVDTDDLAINIASQVTNGASRFGKGQDVIIVERPGSVKLPGLKQMESEGWVGLVRDPQGNTVAHPITRGFKPKMNGAREDWRTMRSDGTSEMFNANGYQITTIRDPKGNLYHYRMDVGGTGSAGGGSGMISGIADSGMKPMVTYQVTPVSKNDAGQYVGAFNRKAAAPAPKESKFNLLKLMFSKKARAEYNKRASEYHKSEEGKARNKELQKQNERQKQSLQRDVDIVQQPTMYDEFMSYQKMGGVLPKIYGL